MKRTHFKWGVDDKELTKKTAQAKKGISGIGKTGKSAFGLAGMAGGIMIAIAAAAKLVKVLWSCAKVAIDFKEETSKLKTIYSENSAEAIQMRNVLVNSFGQSKLAATKMLGSTGDVLASLKLNNEENLKLSGTVAMLATDIASFSNIQGGGAGAATIITKAILGEKEALIGLGQKISEGEIKQKLLEKGTEKLTGVALKQARAYAILELVTENAGVAIGDYARTSESTANQIRLMGARTEDLALAIGEKLLPAVGDIVTFYNEVVGVLTKWIALDAAEEIMKEKDEFNALASALRSSIDNQELYNTAFAQLTKQYPTLIRFLKTEGDMNKNILDWQKLVNNQYKIKFEQAVRQGVMDKLQAERIELERNELKAKTKLYEMAKQIKGEEWAINASNKERMKAVKENIGFSEKLFALGGTYSKQVNDIAQVSKILNEYDKAKIKNENEINVLKKEQAKIEEKYADDELTQLQKKAKFEKEQEEYFNNEMNRYSESLKAGKEKAEKENKRLKEKEAQEKEYRDKRTKAEKESQQKAAAREFEKEQKEFFNNEMNRYSAGIDADRERIASIAILEEKIKDLGLVNAEIAGQFLNFDFGTIKDMTVEQIDELILKLDDFAAKNIMITNVVKSMGSAITSGFKAEGLKGALRNVLNVMLDFAAAQLAIGKATAITRTIFGDFISLGELIAAMTALAAAKVAVASFRSGTPESGYKGPGTIQTHTGEETIHVPDNTTSHVYTKSEVANMLGGTDMTETNELLKSVRDLLAKQKIIATPRGLVEMIDKENENYL